MLLRQTNSFEQTYHSRYIHLLSDTKRKWMNVIKCIVAHSNLCANMLGGEANRHFVWDNAPRLIDANPIFRFSMDCDHILYESFLQSGYITSKHPVFIVLHTLYGWCPQFGRRAYTHSSPTDNETLISFGWKSLK